MKDDPRDWLDRDIRRRKSCELSRPCLFVTVLKIRISLPAGFMYHLTLSAHVAHQLCIIQLTVHAKF
jgi:hypothetical protein